MSTRVTNSTAEPTRSHRENAIVRSLDSGAGPPLASQMTNHGTSESQPRISIGSELHAAWLQKYQQWFPILHHTSVSNSFGGMKLEHGLIQKAIMAVTLWDMSEIPLEKKETETEQPR
ncbi:hypothetical protein BJX70DRAFT_398362 [Aspergillus crustosus]